MSTSTSSGNGNGISQRKLLANRANAQKSTGPRTQAGKQKSSLNALTHGLRARLATDTLVCEHERQDFQALSEALHEELNPQSPLQHLLAERLALLAWKMRRTAAAEAALLDDTLSYRRKHQQQDNDRARRRNPESPKIKPLPTAADLIAEHAKAPAKNNPFLTLHRYDQATQREFHRTLKQYQSLQRQAEDHLDEELLDDILAAEPNEPTDQAPADPQSTIGDPQSAIPITPGPNEPTDDHNPRPTQNLELTTPAAPPPAQPPPAPPEASPQTSPPP